MSLETVWRLLATVSGFDLVIRHPQALDVLHQAFGLISVEAGPTGSIIWHEQGAWVKGPLTGIRFTNTTRWEQIPPAGIRISHQRRGPEPLFLSTLRPDGTGRWTGEPHQCGSDRYLPSLVAAEDHLFLAWDVASPTDPYRWEMQARYPGSC
jgi:hypothetical protein